jgi:aryl-alcohol dehydrogenase-like predicted oxidoreductase
MKYRPLGRSGVQVSQLCFGTLSFGGDADPAMSAKMYRAVRDTGINFIDTADQYNNGRAEEILGELMRGERDSLVIATKCFHATGPDPDMNARGASRRHITRALEASLRRLKTDRVEVLFLHKYDPLTPIEESLRALEDLVRAGKVLYPAVSNYAAWQTQDAVGIQHAAGWTRLEVTQPLYNLVKRQAEVEILPQAAAKGIAVTPYSPAAGGLLTGKYMVPGTQGRFVNNKAYDSRYGEKWVQDTAVAFARFCKEHGLHPMSAAVAWVGAHPAVTAPIIGARNTDQLQASLDSIKIPMTPELRAEISALSRTPPPAHDRLEEATKV